MQKPSKVLIVDDDESVRETFDALLMKEGLSISYAAGGREALRMAAKSPPDVILLDVMMPGMDGFETCRRLKANAAMAPIPVVMVTALDGKEDLLKGLYAGADEFLTKPVRGDELRARIRTMLRIKGQYDALQLTLQLREKLSERLIGDVRSPLSGISAAAGMLAKRTGDPQMQELVDVIRSNVSRMDDQLTDMLVMIRLEAGEPLLARRSVGVGSFLSTVIEDRQDAAAAAGITLLLLQPPVEQTISVDPPLFRRMLARLVDNAIRHSSPAGTVSLAVEYPDAELEMPGFWVRFSVSDEGDEIPARLRSTLFDDFSALAVKEREASQSILGLAFCRRVAEAHGGRIYVTDNTPKGTVFTVEI